MATVVTHSVGEGANSSPARVIPTGTVTIPFVLALTDYAQNDVICFAKVPPGAAITHVRVAHGSQLGSSTELSIGVEYQTSAQSGDTFTSEVAGLLAAETSNGAANLVHSTDRSVAGALGVPFVVPDSANSDCKVLFKITGANPAASTFFGSVTYTLQTQERFVTASGQ